jgi:hypothetical protein
MLGLSCSVADEATAKDASGTDLGFQFKKRAPDG